MIETLYPAGRLHLTPVREAATSERGIKERVMDERRGSVAGHRRVMTPPLLGARSYEVDAISNVNHPLKHNVQGTIAST
jgi:hypothetical protein